MQKLETAKENYSNGDQIQDSDGVDYVITHVDDRGADVREIENPQRTRHVGFDELNSKFTNKIHEGRICPNQPKVDVVYEDPKFSKGIIRKVESTKRAASAVLYN
jgi:hypothetical protein